MKRQLTEEQIKAKDERKAKYDLRFIIGTVFDISQTQEIQTP
jgi:hypothetical protein